MGHRKWKETKRQPGTAGPGNMLGGCLVSFHFLWAILCPQAVNILPPCLYRRGVICNGSKGNAGGQNNLTPGLKYIWPLRNIIFSPQYLENILLGMESDDKKWNFGSQRTQSSVDRFEKGEHNCTCIIVHGKLPLVPARLCSISWKTINQIQFQIPTKPNT